MLFVLKKIKLTAFLLSIQNKIANFVGYREGDGKPCLSASAKIPDGGAVDIMVIEIIKMLFASLDFVNSDNL